MAKYTVQDTTTGKNVTFEWDDPNPPTDADMEEVFKQSKSFRAEQPPLEGKSSTLSNIVGSLKQAVRPTLEMGGATAGGLLAVPVSLGPWGPATEAAGIGGGYLAGKYVADIAEQLMGMKKPTTAKEAIINAITKDIPNAGIVGASGPMTESAISSIVGKLPAMAQRLYASAVKMPLSRKWTKVRGEEGTTMLKRAVDKGIQEQVPPSEYGLEKANAGRKSVGQQISDEVNNTPGTSDLDTLMRNGLSKARVKASRGEAPADELKAVDDYEEAFKKSRNSDLTARELQDIKTELYDRINFDKTSGKADSLVETMRKGLAHDAMKTLENMNPSLKGLNKSDAGWINLQEALERSLARRGNRDIIDLGTKVILGKESWPLAIINQTVGHPQVKALLSFMINKASKNITGETGKRVMPLLVRPSPIDEALSNKRKD